MFTIFILFTTLTTKAYGKCEEASKQTPDLRIFYRAGIAPTGFEIPGSAPDDHTMYFVFYDKMIVYQRI